MANSEEIIYARVYPEVRSAIAESSKHQNRTYSIVLSLRQGTNNIDIRVICTKNLPLINIYNGAEESNRNIHREESLEEVKFKLKRDIEKLLNDHSAERGKTSLTINIREGAYTSTEWQATEHRYETTKQANYTKERRKKLAFDSK